MNFSVDKENKKVKVERGFAAPIDKVWAAWTQSEILDQWWAPKPWKAETKSMDFREGGRWLYAMVSPEGEKHWSFADYFSIDPQKSFSGNDGFCDEDGNVTDEFPGSTWHISFAGQENQTVVTVHISYASLDDLEKTLEMGFQEGFTMGLSNLEELLAQS